MKKFVIAFAVIVILVAALVSTGTVSAQGPTPVDPQGIGDGSGYGRGGRMGGRGASVAAGDGLLHDGMIAVLSDKLGISVDDLNARLTSGETMSQIASEQGLSTEEFVALMSEARSQAIDQAVSGGTLTQEQGEWLKTRGAASGNMGRQGTGRGGMRGQRGGMVNCPYLNATNP